jgi:GcrA cell cycle regulator
MPAKAETSWSDEELQVLRDGYGHMSAGWIASLLPGRTRNAVIGKAYRLGLRSGVILPRVSFHKPPPKGPRIRKEKTMFPKAPPKIAPEPLPLDKVWEPLPGSTPVALNDLREWHCRWPVIGGKSCGRRKLDGSSYCETHAVTASSRGFVAA